MDCPIDSKELRFRIFQNSQNQTLKLKQDLYSFELPIGCFSCSATETNIILFRMSFFGNVDFNCAKCAKIRQKMPISYLIVPGFASSSKTFLPQPSRDLIQHESGTWSKVTRNGLLPLPDPKKKE